MLVVLGGARLVAADDVAARTAAIKKLMAAQADALVLQYSDFGEALNKTLAPDAYSNVATGLVGAVAVDIGQTKIGWSKTCGWVSAEAQFEPRIHPEMMQQAPPGKDPVEVHLPSQMRHWMALVVADGDSVKAKAMRVVYTTSDKVLGTQTFDYIATLPVVKSPPPHVAWLAQPAAAAKELSADPSTTVFGTSKNDHAFGQAAGKKLLASWAKLNLELVMTEHDDDHGEVIVGDCAAAYGTVRMKVGKKFILLDGFAITHKVGDRWELVAYELAPTNIDL